MDDTHRITKDKISNLLTQNGKRCLSDGFIQCLPTRHNQNESLGKRKISKPKHTIVTEALLVF
jgi:hypothetical protein